jgi:hypothetical protein
MDKRAGVYVVALIVALEREPKLRKGTRRAVLELRMEECRDQLIAGLYLDTDPRCPHCDKPGRPICWCAIHKNHDHSVDYVCQDGHRFWVEDPLGPTKALRAGRAFAGVTKTQVHDLIRWRERGMDQFGEEAVFKCLHSLSEWSHTPPEGQGDALRSFQSMSYEDQLQTVCDALDQPLPEEPDFNEPYRCM